MKLFGDPQLTAPLIHQRLTGKSFKVVNLCFFLFNKEFTYAHKYDSLCIALTSIATHIR